MVKVKETKVSYKARLKDGHEVVKAILGLQEKEVDAIFKLENKELEDAQ